MTKEELINIYTEHLQRLFKEEDSLKPGHSEWILIIREIALYSTFIEDLKRIK